MGGHLEHLCHLMAKDTCFLPEEAEYAEQFICLLLTDNLVQLWPLDQGNYSQQILMSIFSVFDTVLGTEDKKMSKK